MSSRSPSGCASTRAGQPVGHDRLVHGGDAAAAEQVEPAADALGDVVGEVVAAGVELLGGERRRTG